MKYTISGTNVTGTTLVLRLLMRGRDIEEISVSDQKGIITVKRINPFTRQPGTFVINARRTSATFTPDNEGSHHRPPSWTPDPAPIRYFEGDS